MGNSFSNNATRLLPELAKAGGHQLISARAVTGGCSLERHGNALAAELADPADPKGRIYNGKSLRENLGKGPWDVITIQQYSLHVGYRWGKAGKLGKDANHANLAGEYLGALVWYGFLFGESPERLSWEPPGLASAFAAHWRRVAAEVLLAGAVP